MDENKEKENIQAQVVPVENKQVSSQLQEFGDSWRIAAQYSKSDLVPEAYKNKPENVIIALGMAQKTGFDVFTIMQNLSIVKGKASWSGSFCRTLIESTGLYKDIDLIEVGKREDDTWGYYAQAVRKTDGKIVKGATVTIGMARMEGWIAKNPKWKSMPELMLQYRATAFFARVYASSAINGLQTSEEIDDVYSNSNKVMEDIL